ncbi:MAG: C39 family peptidase [Candidatus Krumholzibacteria bacterium]|nr:C39 family peptidase [Candidatus Krumholzibacteria bacterium]
MAETLELSILRQPDDSTCGATCLHALYGYYDDTVPLETLVSDVQRLEDGGTLGVYLASHALRRGYEAAIYTYNLQVFDPSWFGGEPVDLAERLRRQMAAKDDAKLRVGSQAYIDFLEGGGRILYQDLTSGLLRRYLKRGIPIIAGLSATYLYHTPREFGPECEYDDLRGTPSGHFVVLSGYDPATRRVRVADPWVPNPGGGHYYDVDTYRLVCAILLGVLTYDANLLVIHPKKGGRRSR